MSGFPRCCPATNTLREGFTVIPKFAICLPAKSCLIDREPLYQLSYPGIRAHLLSVANYIHVTQYSANITPGVILSSMTKSCRKHGQTKHFLRADGSFRCGKCASEWVIRHRQKKKLRLVAAFGGKCILCDYDTYVGALDFHHVSRKTKVFSLSVKGLSHSWESILREAQKCVLVCKNCHAEVEAGITKLGVGDIISNVRDALIVVGVGSIIVLIGIAFAINRASSRSSNPASINYNDPL